jgi:hypothetical protein
MASECAACHQPLVVEIELEYSDEEMETGESSAAGPSGSQPQTVPDDVQLACGCHFHWFARPCSLSRIALIPTTPGSAFSMPTKLNPVPNVTGI